MADRIPPKRVPPRERKPIRVPRSHDVIDDLPPVGGPFETPPPREASSSLANRLAAKASERELTAHPAEGPVEVQYGGPLPRGGKLIYFKRLGGTFFFDFSFGEGPIEEIANIRWTDNKSSATVHATTEIHLGTTGDTGSALINSVDPAYVAPENIARLSMRCGNPTQTTGLWSPFDLLADVKGRVLYNPSSAATEFNGFPASIGWDALTNARYSVGVDTAHMNGVDWGSFEDYCEFPVDTGLVRWSIALLVDTQDSLESWLSLILTYGRAHLRYENAKYGVWVDAARALAVDNDANVIEFDDTTPEAANMAAEVTWVGKGIDEAPTVVIVDYSDAEAAFVGASVTVPDTFDPATDWVERRVPMPAYTAREMARRWGVAEFNLLNLDYKDITLPGHMVSFLPSVGDRVRVRSSRLIAADVTPPNENAVVGAEECVITDKKLGGAPMLRAGLYRDAMFGEAIDPSGPPNPPGGPPDPDADPPCPLSIEAPFSDPAEYGMVIVEPPADDSTISYYDVRDIFSGDVSVGWINPPADPLGPDGKYHKSFAALVHTDPDGDIHLAVRVVSVSYAGNTAAGCSSTSWDVMGGGGGDDGCVSTSGELEYANVPDATYSAEGYNRILAPTKLWSTASLVASGDFFYSTTGNASGIIWAKSAGQYDVGATIGWEPNADSALRALAFFYIYAGMVRHIGKTYISIDAGGTGVTNADPLIVSGGTLLSGGVPLSGAVLTTGGVITGLSYTGGIGYSVAPTSVTVASGGGYTLTAHLPAAFTIADLDFDCSTASTVVGGQIVAESVIPAVNDAGCPTRHGLVVSLPIEQYGGILVGVLQHSGGNLDVLARIIGDPADGNWRAASLFWMKKTCNDHAPFNIRTCPEPG